MTDKGTAFTSNDFKMYCEHEKIEHIAITICLPYGNGQVVRVHGTLILVNNNSSSLTLIRILVFFVEILFIGLITNCEDKIICVNSYNNMVYRHSSQKI